VAVQVDACGGQADVASAASAQTAA